MMHVCQKPRLQRVLFAASRGGLARSDDVKQQQDDDNDEDEGDAAASVIAYSRAHAIAAKAKDENKDDEKNKHEDSVPMRFAQRLLLGLTGWMPNKDECRRNGANSQTLLDVVDDHDFDRAGSALEPEAELFLECGEESGAGGVRGGWIAGVLVGSPLQVEVIPGGEAGDLVRDAWDF